MDKKMTKQQAYDILNQTIAGLTATRAQHETLALALKTLAEQPVEIRSVDKEKVK